MEEQPGFVQQTPPHLLHWLYQKLRGKEVRVTASQRHRSPPPPHPSHVQSLCMYMYTHTVSLTHSLVIYIHTQTHAHTHTHTHTHTGTTFPTFAVSMQENCTDTKGIRFQSLTSTKPTSREQPVVAVFIIVLLPPFLQLYGLYTAGEGETVELPSLAKVVGGDEESLSPDRFKE